MSRNRRASIAHLRVVVDRGLRHSRPKSAPQSPEVRARETPLIPPVNWRALARAIDAGDVVLARMHERDLHATHGRPGPWRVVTDASRPLCAAAPTLEIARLFGLAEPDVVRMAGKVPGGHGYALLGALVQRGRPVLVALISEPRMLVPIASVAELGRLVRRLELTHRLIVHGSRAFAEMVAGQLEPEPPR